MLWKRAPYYEKQVRSVTARLGGQTRKVLKSILQPAGMKPLKSASQWNASVQLMSPFTGFGNGGLPQVINGSLFTTPVAIRNMPYANADEGDRGIHGPQYPGGDPHAVLEGMMIAGLAIGADEGCIYCRAEYPCLPS